MSAVHRPPPSSAEALPKQFVTSLRILFDILDESRTGYVRLCDIESRWHEEGVKGLPSGVIETLRRVTPASGYLTFDNFVSGLKMALLRNHPGGNLLQPGKENQGPPPPSRGEPPKNNSSSNSRQNLHMGSNKVQKPRPDPNHLVKKPVAHPGYPSSTRSNNSNTAAVRPNNVLNSLQQNGESNHQGEAIFRSREQVNAKRERDNINIPYRSHEGRSSLDKQTLAHFESEDVAVLRRKDYTRKPLPRPKSEEIHLFRSRDNVSSGQLRSDRVPSRPNRPPSYAKAIEKQTTSQGTRAVSVPDPQNPPAVPPRNTNSRIMSELKNWQREQQLNKRDPRLPSANSDSKLMEKNKMGGNEIYVNFEQIKQHAATFKPSASTASVPSQQKPTVRRQNSRRHTLSSGVDYNMIRRMKQLEQEKDMLLQGLEAIDKTREWYQRQVANVNNKTNMLEKTSYTEASVESNQEKLDYQRVRITEINHHLKSLLESDKGFPVHMNLAVRSGLDRQDGTIKMLKTQNKQLTTEVGDRSDKISQLEQEKASLIRELFEAKSQNKSNYDDTTFL